MVKIRVVLVCFVLGSKWFQPSKMLNGYRKTKNVEQDRAKETRTFANTYLL